MKSIAIARCRLI